MGSGYEIDVMQVLRSSWVIVLMFFLSILVVAFTIERWIYYQRTKLDSDKFLDKIKSLIVDGKYDEAVEFCRKQPGSIPIVIKAGLDNRDLPREEIDKLMESIRMEERIKLERYLGVLGTLGSITPFIGLLGTVLGIIKAFRDLASSGASAGPTVVMVGIAEALIATAVGLGVAIPSVVVFNFYMRKVKNITVEMEAVARRFIILLANYGEGSAHAGRKR